MITDPFKLYLVVIYHPPSQLGSFVYEPELLLSALPVDYCSLLILGDMNIYMADPPSVDLSLLNSCSQFSYSYGWWRSRSHTCPLSNNTCSLCRPWLTDNTHQKVQEALRPVENKWCQSGLCYLPLLPLLQLLMKGSKKGLTMPQTVRNYILLSRISLTLHLRHKLSFSLLMTLQTFFTEKLAAISVQFCNPLKCYSLSSNRLQSSLMVPQWWNYLPSAVSSSDRISTFKSD